MVQVQTDGAFSIVSHQPAWTFGGNAGGAISQLSYVSGTDGAGLYQKISFRFTLNGIANGASIRAYQDRPIVVFDTWHNGGAGAMGELYKRRSRASFPAEEIDEDALFRRGVPIH